MAACGVARGAGPLRLDRSIPLPGVKGRIDHLALDREGSRLFAAALGNGSIEVVDLAAGKRIRSIAGLPEPQGLAYVPSVHRLYAACAGDGSLRIYDAGSWSLIRKVEYGDDADNVRYDAAAGRIWTGYGAGALGAIDLDGRRLADVRLDAHPESFQLEARGPRIFVNLPKSGKVAVVDRVKAAVVASWPVRPLANNFPMALDEGAHRIFVGFRTPAELAAFDTGSGRQIGRVATIGDADDVFYDGRRNRIYAIGGEGAVAVIDAGSYRETSRVRTAPGARTGLYSPDLDRLFVAVRESGGRSAEVRVFAPE